MSGRWSGRRAAVDRAWWARRLAAGHDSTCGLCGTPILLGQAWDVDHTVPLAAGGQIGRDNQRLAHRTCNRAAGQRLSTDRGRDLRAWPTRATDSLEGS